MTAQHGGHGHDHVRGHDGEHGDGHDCADDEVAPPPDNFCPRPGAKVK